MYRVRHIDDPEGQTHITSGPAIRAMAGMIRALEMTRGEARAFNAWFEWRNYRSVGLALWHGKAYELAVMAKGERQRFRIEPIRPRLLEHLPPAPVERAQVAPLNGSEVPRPGAPD